MKKSIFIMLMLMIMFSTAEVFAVNNSPSWWNDAYNFFNGNTANANRFTVTALTDIENIISFVGNMVFFLVTVILGVKYIWGSVDAKADVKDGLVTLVIAAVFFYGWNTVKALFINSSGLIFIENDYQSTAKAIYSTILYICNFFAVGGIVYIGVKYLLAGAEGKAQLKARGVPIVLGIIMVYCTLTFLTFIVNAMGI